MCFQNFFLNAENQEIVMNKIFLKFNFTYPCKVSSKNGPIIKNFFQKVYGPLKNWGRFLLRTSVPYIENWC